MDKIEKEVLSQLLWSLVPEDGASVGNGALGRKFRAAAEEKGLPVTELAFATLKEELIHAGRLVRGRGRGGSVKRARGGEGEFRMAVQTAPDETEKSDKRPVKSRKSKKKARKKRGDQTEVLSYRHQSKRKNNPEVGMVTPATDPDEGATRWCYDPHIDPALQFDFGRAQVEKLIEDALARGDEETLRGALEELKRYSAPYLNWSGKAEGATFEVDTVSLHVHERIDPASILAGVSKVQGKGKSKITQGKQADLFAAPFENLPLRDAIDFYKHEKGWSNRLIAGDSLQVMNSLIRKEGMAGRVQMIYIDPPYGIKYGSNFQPFVNKRNVAPSDKDEDLTQEPEMIKAFRDTWELGIHSYLTYLRDRLVLSRELLADSGSVFVQISDENLHLIRALMDEIFGVKNWCGDIRVVKTSGQTDELLATVTDNLLWYGKSKEKVKYRRLFQEKGVGFKEIGQYYYAEFSDGTRRRLSGSEIRNPDRVSDRTYPFRISDISSNKPYSLGTIPFDLNGKEYLPPSGRYWTHSPEGRERIKRANRILAFGNSVRFVGYLKDFPLVSQNAQWLDTGVSGFSAEKVYVVQTNQKVIERCLLMTTDPGDLVLDPTCGSGTTAFVAEKWGRRWITCDTSRVAVTLAKQRLMTASYDYYALRYPHEGLRGGFIYKTVPHITLKSIANNPEIDEIYARMHPAIEEELAELNKALMASSFRRKPESRAEAKILDTGMRRHDGDGMREWEVPFDFPDDWPDAAREPFDAFHAARRAMQRKMDNSIAAHAAQETLYDQPEMDRSKLRITGPFSVEAVPFPTVLSLEESEQPAEADAAIARSGESARQHQWRDELLKTGIRGKGGDTLRFAELETLPGTTYLHASGHLDSGERVVVSFGPEHAALEQRQVELALREAGELFPLPKMILYCAFTFDPEAAKDIDQLKGITALKAQMNTDLLTADLKKGRAGNQSFWLMGQPDVEVFSSEFLVFSDQNGTERRLCSFDWFKELSGFDSLAEVHGLDRDDLFLYALLSQGGEVWDYLANAQGWDLDTGEYRRGSGAKQSGGVPAVSWSGERLPGGTGNLDSALREAGLPELATFQQVVDSLRRDSETSGRVNQIAKQLNIPLIQLKTENLKLRTLHQVEVNGFDYFDTRSGELISGGKGKIALWLLDTDYDERSLFPKQVFFPMAGKKEGWRKLKKNLRAELNEDLLEQFHGTVSLPFEAGENRKVAVKIVDDRGIESLKIVTLED